MGLTADEFVSLQTTGLVKFFDLHREIYLQLARRAYSYAHSYLDEAGIEVRVNDVSVALEPALHVRAELLEFLAEHRLTQQYWFRRFSDLIVETAWAELSTGSA
jgi:hypothetical protein